MLALYQPVAVDLRFIVFAMKINADLERVGDHATNSAEDVIFIVEARDVRHRSHEFSMDRVALNRPSVERRKRPRLPPF